MVKGDVRVKGICSLVVPKDKDKPPDHCTKMPVALHHIHDLVLVAGHAPFLETTATVPDHPEEDAGWALQSFQRGEPPLYIDHIKRGVALLAANPRALLIFSGGFTRREAGCRWSEAGTYAAIAQHCGGWIREANPEQRDSLEARTALEDFSRDSFENLLFSLCRFHQVVGRYPRHVSVVSWAFKRERFDLHRQTIRFPPDRFHFEGFNEPVGLPSALRGEAVTLGDFTKNPYGSEGRLAEKRVARNPFHRQHDFRTCPGLAKFFDFIDNPTNQRKTYPQPLPWEG